MEIQTMSGLPNIKGIEFVLFPNNVSISALIFRLVGEFML